MSRGKQGRLVLLATLLTGCLPTEPTRPTPAISGIDPPEAAPGQTVTIQGAAFDPSQANSIVRFGDVVAGQAETWSDTAIEIAVPETEPGEVAVVIRVDGLESDPVPFTVAAAPLPQIDSIEPSGALPGEPVTVSGVSFGDDRQPDDTVIFAEELDAGSGITGWTDTTIDLTVPEGAVSGGVVVVTNAGESAPFVYRVGGSGGPTLADVQDQVFTPHCAVSECHDSQTARSGLVLDSGLAYANIVGVASRQRPELLRVSPGNPDESYLYLKIARPLPPEGDRMPQGLLPLSADLIELVRTWIEAGATIE